MPSLHGRSPRHQILYGDPAYANAAVAHGLLGPDGRAAHWRSPRRTPKQHMTKIQSMSKNEALTPAQTQVLKAHWPSI